VSTTPDEIEVQAANVRTAFRELAAAFVKAENLQDAIQLMFGNAPGELGELARRLKACRASKASNLAKRYLRGVGRGNIDVNTISIEKLLSLGRAEDFLPDRFEETNA